jgi:hypothetical protein
MSVTYPCEDSASDSGIDMCNITSCDQTEGYEENASDSGICEKCPGEGSARI